MEFLMSYDLGYQPDVPGNENFWPVFASLMQEYDLSFSGLCRRAGLDERTAREAINRGAQDIPMTWGVLQQLLSAIDKELTVSWLLAGGSVVGPKTLQERRRELRTRVWKFGERSGISSRH